MIAFLDRLSEIGLLDGVTSLAGTSAPHSVSLKAKQLKEIPFICAVPKSILGGAESDSRKKNIRYAGLVEMVNPKRIARPDGTSWCGRLKSTTTILNMCSLDKCSEYLQDIILKTWHTTPDCIPFWGEQITNKLMEGQYAIPICTAITPSNGQRVKNQRRRTWVEFTPFQIACLDDVGKRVIATSECKQHLQRLMGLWGSTIVLGLTLRVNSFQKLRGGRTRVTDRMLWELFCPLLHL